MRIGIGYDIHPQQEGRPLILGGVAIPAAQGLSGHSDADVLTHAIMDALLGAAGLGDIGQHFPASEPAYAGARSLDLLGKVAAMVGKAGFAIVNVDAAVIAQEPQLAPYIGLMREEVARCLGLPASQVSVKAKSPESLGALGRSEGIACIAVALLQEAR